MATSFNTLRLQQTPPHSLFIAYTEPPAPKPPSRRPKLNTAPVASKKRHDIDQAAGSELESNSNLKDAEIMEPASYKAETVDSTCLDSQIDDHFPSWDEWESVRSKQSGFARELCVERKFESSTQPATAEGSNRDNAFVIGDDQDEPSTDTDDDEYRPREDDADTQTIEQLVDAAPLAGECHNEGCPPTGTEFAFDSEVVEEAGMPVSRLPNREPTSMPLESIVYNSPTQTSYDAEKKKTVQFANEIQITNTEFSNIIERDDVSVKKDGYAQADRSVDRPTQEARCHILVEATVCQPLSSVEKKGKGKCELPALENASASVDSDSDGDDKDKEKDKDKDNPVCNTVRTRNRKRSTPANTLGHKRHSRTLNLTSKQHLKCDTHSAKRQKSSSFRDRLLSNHLSIPKPLSAAQYSDHDTDTCYSDDSSEESGDRGGFPGRNKRSMSTAHPYRSRGHKRKHNRSSTDEDDEYEVEKILDARVNCRKLQYRAKWLGYEDDPQWYDASNFKNSPHKLREFHSASHTYPGPPKRLGRWEQCWEEDRDADDHPDDNKPEQSYPKGGKL